MLRHYQYNFLVGHVIGKHLLQPRDMLYSKHISLSYRLKATHMLVTYVISHKYRLKSCFHTLTGEAERQHAQCFDLWLNE